MRYLVDASLLKEENLEFLGLKKKLEKVNIKL